MRISKIQMLGFKSFAQKTEIELDPGITAIVGPNGCGKSNVIDAVKWVLGEQRPSSLRAKEMLDVIFAGTPRRKPVGMAEVALVFDNEDGTLPVEQSEVVFTRRLYRSGDSEYLLNGRACRLKDLRELLMDTGSGLDAMTIMEQGRIDAILTANPVERRAVFEEAAGIGKYKNRRRETIRRLDRVADDLTRLRDVVEITEKQLRSLRYQASRARKFREYTEELQKKRVTWALYRYHLLLSERNELTGRLDGLAQEEQQANEALRRLVTELSGEENELEKAAERLRQGERRLHELDGEIRSAVEGAEHARRLSAELTDRVSWYEDEIRVSERRSEELAAEGGELADGLAALAAEVTLRERELGDADAVIGAEREEERERERALVEAKRERLALVQRGTELRNERGGLARVLSSGAALSERILRRREVLAVEREQVAAACASAGDRRAGAEEAAEAALGRLESLKDEAREQQLRERDLSDQASAADRRITAVGSRLDVLRSMRERHEGMDAPVQKVLAEAAREGSALAGVRGVVADLIEVEGGDADAVELALGACAQGIVTDRLEDALQAISWLKEQELGRALFIPLSEVREAGPSYEGNGVARQAAGAVRAGEEYESLIRALLSDSILVEDLDRAVKVARDQGRALRIVTGGGEVLNRIGTISGGRGQSTVSLIARNAEIETLAGQLKQEQDRREALEEALEAVAEGRRRLEERIADARDERDAAVEELRRIENETERAEVDARRLEEEERVLAEELAELTEESERAEARDAELAGEEESLAEAEREFGERLAELERSLAEAREKARTAAERRSEVRVVLAGARERLAGSEARRKAVARAAHEAAESAEVAAKERESCARRRDESALEAEVADRRAEECSKKREKLLTEVGELKSAHDKVRSHILSRRTEADELREEHERYRTSLEEFRLKESEVRTKLDGLLERVQEEFELDLVDLYEGFSPEGIDWEELDRTVGELRGKIDRMGNVNLEALDQLAEVEERVQFLHGEEQDLVKSRESLLEILRKVNRESRERFERSFAEVRENFREMFRKLFGGGNAEIHLEEGEDILEAGIDIVVRPPGRELQNLNLLSGGEKTLTAVALLFAIFKARPSPFALMDEVDAALDESNIDRFVSVLREFSHASQFIIISHNKRTMSEADAIYGVSMPEAGVSQQFSMRLSGNGEKGGNGKAAAAAPAWSEDASAN